MNYILPIALALIAIIIVVRAYYLGKKTGIEQEKVGYSDLEKEYRKKLFSEESQRKELQRDIETLMQENQRYLQFLVSIPGIVKDLVSNLSFEETVSSIFRLTKYLVDPETIELYMFDVNSETLNLVISYGSDRENKKVNLGEGIVGVAADNRVMVTRTSLQFPEADEGLDIAAPIVFRDRLIGVIGLGKIEMTGGNERRFIAMVADLAGVTLQSCEYLETAKTEAITDVLTGLYNRRYFYERAREAAYKAINYNSPISIFIFDIDHFKKYNDLNGHAEGDYLLKEISKLLKEQSRGTDVIARYGGEEFIVLMPGTEKESAFIYAEKIRQAIAHYPFRHREKQPAGFVSVSGGVASFPFDGNSIDAVIRLADEALYDSKHSGRNMVKKYEPFQFSA